MTKEDKALKDDLVRLRDTEQNSWANVAATLGLGSPGAARRAYSSPCEAPHRQRPGRSSAG